MPSEHRPRIAAKAKALHLLRNAGRAALLLSAVLATVLWIGSYWFWLNWQVSSKRPSPGGTAIVVSMCRLERGRFEGSYRYTEIRVRPEQLTGPGAVRLDNIPRWNYGALSANYGSIDYIGFPRHWYPSYERREPKGAVRTLLSVPMWAPALISYAMLLPELWTVLRRYRSAMRRRKGLCSICGFDLRATPLRCPECGEVAEAIRIV